MHRVVRLYVDFDDADQQLCIQLLDVLTATESPMIQEITLIDIPMHLLPKFKGRYLHMKFVRIRATHASTEDALKFLPALFHTLGPA